jgi:hypothetical protein
MPIQRAPEHEFQGECGDGQKKCPCALPHGRNGNGRCTRRNGGEVIAANDPIRTAGYDTIGGRRCWMSTGFALFVRFRCRYALPNRGERWKTSCRVRLIGAPVGQ